MPEFQVGELVDITVRCAKVVSLRRDTRPGPALATQEVTFLCAGATKDADRLVTFSIAAAPLKLDRVAPAEWPPQAGDLWRDRHGIAWFAYVVPTEPDVLYMRSATGGRWSIGHDAQLDDNAPWSLVHRELSGDVDA